MLRKVIRTLLIEGRLDDVKKKYGQKSGSKLLPGLPDEVIDELSAGDPSGNNKYLMWMAREVLEDWSPKKYYQGEYAFGQGRDPSSVIQYVQDFHKNQQRLKQKDIMAYEEAEDVRDAVAALGTSKTQKKKKTKLEGADKLYEDENFLLLHPKSHKAVCMYGASTKWCITETGGEAYESYIDEGKIFYFLIDKTDGEKIAFVYDKEGISTIWNAKDEQIHFGSVLFGMASAMDSRESGDYQGGPEIGENASLLLTKLKDLMVADSRKRLEEREKRIVTVRIFVRTISRWKSPFEDVSSDKQKKAIKFVIGSARAREDLEVVKQGATIPVDDLLDPNSDELPYVEVRGPEGTLRSLVASIGSWPELRGREVRLMQFETEWLGEA